jgi:NitT/TauT family transport system substrate-binding protein
LLILPVLFLQGCGPQETGGGVDVETVIVEKEPVILRVAFPSVIDIADVAALLAFERMVEEGVIALPTFYAQSELAAAAVAAGEADIGVGAATVWLTAIGQGAEVQSIMEQAANAWAIMAVKPLETCEDLDGTRMAIHSEGAVSTAMLYAYIDLNCPGTEPQYLVIPGSENRAAALMAGEIDATPAELIDALRINGLRPDEFNRIADFSRDLPGLATTGVWVRSEILEENPEAVKSLIHNLLEVHRQIQDDPEWFVGQVARLLTMNEEDAALLPSIVEAMLAIDHYPVNGGLTVEKGEYTIRFFTDSGRLEPGLVASDVYNLALLGEVLDEIGVR